MLSPTIAAGAAIGITSSIRKFAAVGEHRYGYQGHLSRQRHAC
jgi:hypothetical protein